MRSGRTGKGDEKLWTLLNDKLDTLRGTGHLSEAVRVAETALDLAQRAFSPEHPAYAISLEKLGQLHDQAGNPTAARIPLLKAHRLLASAVPSVPHAIYRSARRLAFLCEKVGETDDAIVHYEEAIRTGMELGDVSYSELGTMLNNIALLYRQCGRQAEAEPFYLRALEIYEKQLGPEHADVASVLNNLAVFYSNERRFTESEKLHLRALSIRERLLPADHSDIAQSKCNLAVVYHSRGDYARASELYKASLETWEETISKPPADYEIVASNYADLLRSLGKARQATQLEERARKRRH